MGPSVGRLSPSPPSVAWKINCEVAVLLGWGRAVLMQLAHPLVAAGVAEHSVYVAEPARRIARLRSTVRAMLALTFGTPEEIAKAAERINAIHDRVQGRLAEAAGPFAAGTRYSAHDPRLLCWVHATLLDSLPLAYRTFVGPLTREEQDRYCAEATSIEPLLGIPHGSLPASRAELEDYLEAMRGELHVTDAARALARETVRPAKPLAARLAAALLRLPTVGLLPVELRQAYGLSWNPRSERTLRLFAGCLRRALMLTPSPLRHWPGARAAFGRAAAERLRAFESRR